MRKLDGGKIKELRFGVHGSRVDMTLAWWDKFRESVTPQTISNWESGSSISRNHLRKLAKFFEKPEDYFLDKTSQEEQPKRKYRTFLGKFRS